MVRVLINVPKQVKRGEPFDVKLLISHPMESGQRHDDMGQPIPRDIINSFVCSYNGIDVFAEGNPLPHVVRFRFGPRAGAPRVATRIRLATSQTVIAVAKLGDGSCWRDSVDLLVTLAACIDN